MRAERRVNNYLERVRREPRDPDPDRAAVHLAGVRERLPWPGGLAEERESVPVIPQQNCMALRFVS